MSKNQQQPLQDWETVTFKKRTKPVDKNISQKVLSPEEKIDRQKKITPELRKSFQQHRLLKKMTQKELATRASLDLKTVVNIENGTAIFNESEICKCEKALGVKLKRK